MTPEIHLAIEQGKPARARLRRRISKILRDEGNPDFKIGITADYHQRVRYGGYDDYEALIVLYQSRSLDEIREAEADLIEFYREHCDNLVGGGGGSIGRCQPPYYLYLALRKAEPEFASPLLKLGVAAFALAGVALMFPPNTRR